jgi:hypothetical protein
VLPLRHERKADVARTGAETALKAGVARQGLDSGGSFASGLDAALDAGTVGNFLSAWDQRIQDKLAEVQEERANAYLLGRGMAECYWAHVPGRPESLAELFNDRRRAELTRMLGRLEAGTVHPMTPPAISGCLEAWGDVVGDQDWLEAHDLETQLYEQSRRWYQLLVLGQDPTTLILPDARISGAQGLARAARVFLPQIALATIAAALVTVFLVFVDDDELLTSLGAIGGLSAVTIAGLAARGQSAAQKLVLRLRQDAYTDLLAISLTALPTSTKPQPARELRRSIERAVRRRLLTPATPAP